MSLETWVSDQMMEILQFSDRYIAQFLSSLAQKSTSVDELIAKVRETDTIDLTNGKVTNFLAELWGRIPRAAPKVNVEKIAAKQREQALIEMMERNKRYKLIEDDDEMPPPASLPPPAAKKIKKEKKESGSSSEDEEEKQRVKDLQERDEFSERLKKKDKEKQRNVVTAGKGTAFLMLTYLFLQKLHFYL